MYSPSFVLFYCYFLTASGPRESKKNSWYTFETSFFWKKNAENICGSKSCCMSLCHMNLHTVLTWCSHVTYIVLTCYLHSTHLLLTQYSPVTYVLLTCYSHGLTRYSHDLTCYLHSLTCDSLSLTCYSHSLTCYLHSLTCYLQRTYVSYIFLTCYSHVTCISPVLYMLHICMRKVFCIYSAVVTFQCSRAIRVSICVHITFQLDILLISHKQTQPGGSINTEPSKYMCESMGQ